MLHFLHFCIRFSQSRRVPDSDLGWEDMYQEENKSWFDWVWRLLPIRNCLIYSYSLLDIAAVLPSCCCGVHQCGISILSHKGLPPSPSTRSCVFPQRQIYLCQLRPRTRSTCLLYQALSVRRLACLRLLLALPVGNPTTRASQLVVWQDYSCTRIAGMESW